MLERLGAILRIYWKILKCFNERGDEYETHNNEKIGNDGAVYGGDDGLLTIDDKYFLIKTLVDGRVYFGEYTMEENIMTIAVKDYAEDGQITSETATLSLDDGQGTFSLILAE